MTLKNGAFAFLLKVMRKRKGVTLRQIASTAKFSVSYLSLIENGLRVPSYESLQSLIQNMGYGPYESLVLKMQYMHPRSLDQDEEDSLKHLACFAQTFDNSDHMQKGEIKQRANIILANTETIPFELSGPIVSFMTDDRTGRQKAMEVLRSIFRNELFNWNLLDDKC